MAIAYLFVLKNIGVLFKQTARNKTQVVIFLHIFIIALSAVYNYKYMHRGLFFAAQIFLLYFTVVYTKINGLEKELIKVMFGITLIVVVLNDFFFLSYGIELFAEKFGSSYLHAFLIVLYIMYKGEYPIFKILILTIWSMFVLIAMDVMTGTLGILVLFLMLLIFKYSKLNVFLTNPWVVLFGFISLSLFAYALHYITSNPTINYIIVEVMHRNPTLTGRTKIYTFMPKYIMAKPFLGYGMYGARESFHRWIGVHNSQNALTECIIGYGIPNTLILLKIIFDAVKKAKKSIFMFTCIAYLYLTMVMGIVETSINMFFYFLLFLMVINCDFENKTVA